MVAVSFRAKIEVFDGKREKVLRSIRSQDFLHFCRYLFGQTGGKLPEQGHAGADSHVFGPHEIELRLDLQPSHMDHLQILCAPAVFQQRLRDEAAAAAGGDCLQNCGVVIQPQDAVKAGGVQPARGQLAPDQLVEIAGLSRIIMGRAGRASSAMLSSSSISLGAMSTSGSVRMGTET